MMEPLLCFKHQGDPLSLHKQQGDPLFLHKQQGDPPSLHKQQGDPLSMWISLHPSYNCATLSPIDDQHIIWKDRGSKDTSVDKNMQPAPVGVTAETPAPHLEGDGNEFESSESDVEKVERRRSARVRRPPKKLADYLCQIDNRKSGKELKILRKMLEETSRPEERTVLLN